jgi:hypothetical protein
LTADAQLEFHFPRDEEGELLAAAVRRLRARSTQWKPPWPELAPDALRGWRVAKAR